MISTHFCSFYIYNLTFLEDYMQVEYPESQSLKAEFSQNLKRFEQSHTISK